MFSKSVKNTSLAHRRRVFILLATAVPLFLLGFWLMRLTVQPAQAALVDWTTIGWNDAAPVGPATQSFTNVGGTGIDMDVNYSGNMWDNSSVPEIYGGAAPVPPLQTALRWTNNLADTGGALGAANGPAYVELVFSEPVYFDSFTVGSLSFVTGSDPTRDRYEWTEVRAYDINDNPVTASNIITNTHDVDGSGAYTGIVQRPNSPLIIDSGSGVYQARGTSLQGDCDPDCGYDRATFVYDTVGVSRIEVIHYATTGPGVADTRSTYQTSIVLEPLDLRPATPTASTAPAAIGNYVWLDENADGSQDAGEPGIANVVVHLTDDSGAVITTTTDAAGGYRFGGLSAGAYTVTLPGANFAPGGALENLIQTSHPVRPNADFGNQTLPYVLTMTQGAEDLTADFGYVWNPTDVNGNTNNAALGDRVWVDVDSDGAQDPDEPGIPNVTVTLFGAGADGRFGTGDDTTEDTAVTDPTGKYNFDDLPPDAYVVCVDDTTLPAGYTQTGDPDDFGQPAAAPDHCTTAPVPLAPGDTFLNVDFGYNPGVTPVGRLGDLVWFDADASGTAEPIDAGEYGIAGVTVALILDTNGDGSCAAPGDGMEPIIATTVTDADGRYLFDGLPLDDGGGDSDADYLVWVNDTDNVLAGLTQTFDYDGVGTPNCSARALDAVNTEYLDQDFSYTPLNHANGDGAVGDFVWLDQNGDGVQDANEPGIEGVTVTLTLSDTTTRETVTDENGRYYFGGLDPAETVTVTVAPANFTPGGVLENLTNSGDPDGGTPNESVADLSITGPIDLAQDFGYTAGAAAACLGNLLWLDPNADGVYDGADGPDGLPGTDDDEPAIADVTLDLYRDLNGDGLLNPGEPRLGTAVTLANPTDNGCFPAGDLGNYLFTDLPAGDYIVDVTDADGMLAGYWQSRGTDSLTDNSQADPYALSVPASDENLTADFGYYVDAAALGNRVWVDENGNGLQDGGEAALPGAVVELTIDYPDGSQTTLQTTTDSNGFYQFPNLLLDEDFSGDGVGSEPTFTVTAQTPLGYQPTLPDQGGDDLIDSDDPTGVSAQPVQGLTDVSAQPDPTDEPAIASFDFGYIVDQTPPAALGNFVWLDENADGLQDPGEPGIPNVTVNLFDDTGALRDTAVTDNDGGYLFPTLPAGTYTVTLDSGTLPAGVAQTTNPVLPNADFGNQTLPYAVTLAAGDENLTADFGFVDDPNDVNGNDNDATLGDRVWLDGDGDGVQDSDEVGLSNVTVNLIEPGPDGRFGTADDVTSDTTTTDENGRYRFPNLTPGAYVAQVDDTTLPGGVTQTGDPDDFGQPATAPDDQTTTPVPLAPGDTFLNADFGYQPAACGSIGDTVWFDADASGTATVDAGEDGIGGVTVALIADSNGSGAWDASEPVIGSTTTDANGAYLFPCLPLDDGGGDSDADYLVWVNDTDNVLAGLAQTYDFDGTATANLSATAISAGTPDDLDQDFSYTPAGHTNTAGLIGDTIYLNWNGNGVQDPGEFGVEGVLVQLTDSSGVTQTTTTDENGRYTFGGLDPVATYTVTVDAGNFNPGGVLAGLANTADPDGGNDDQSVVDLNTTGPIDLDQDFGYTPPAGQEACLGNLIWLDPNADGVYAGANGPDGLPGTEDDELALLGVTVDLYRDFNGNGLIDPGEPRVNQASSGSPALNNGCFPAGDIGNYRFTGLAAGDYVVHVSDRDGVLFGYWQSRGTDGLTDNSQANPYAITAVANADVLTADFGYYVDAAALGNRVWEDVNNNGVQDGGEPGLSGVPVQLTIDYPNGDQVTLTTTTDGSGVYRFGNLLLDEDFNGDGVSPEPTFTVSVQTPLGYTPAPTDVAGNDRIDSDDPAGVTAVPVQGLTDTTAQPDPNDDADPAIYDFGFVADSTLVGAIGNYVWLDENADGYQDPGEPGIPNVTVNLTNSSGAIISTTVTDAHGGYRFPGLAADTYTITLDSGTLPAGVAQTTNPVLPNADFGNQTLPYRINLGAGAENLTADFGYIYNPTGVNNGTGNGTIGDRLWLDGDGDGVQDPVEIGVGGVTVNLITPGPDGFFGTADDVTAGTQVTDANGRYVFTDLPPGSYVVQVDTGTLPGGVNQTGDPDEPGQPAFVPDNQTTVPLLLAPGDAYLNADFGYQPLTCGTLGDTVWFDADASGTATVDAGETGFDGVTVSLIADSNGDGVWDAGEPVVGTAVTDANGNYLFPCLPLDDGGGDSDADYLVWVNDTENVLGGLDPTYDADGTGTVNLSATFLNAGAPDDLTQDFSYTPAGNSSGDGVIGDRIWLDVNGDGVQDAGEPGLEGALVTLTLPNGATISTRTDENGRYRFGGLDPLETYTVTVSLTDVLSGLENSGDPDGGADSQSVVDLSVTGPLDLDQDFGYTPPAGQASCIGNLIWLDVNANGVVDGGETPLANVTVALYRDLNGNGRLNPGEPLMGVTTTVGTTTDNGCQGSGDLGNYVFNGLPAGDYIVTVTDANGVLHGYWHSLGTADTSNESQVDPDGISVGAASENLTADFGYYLRPAALGNTTWLDQDGDGLQGAAEPGLSGVTVTLQIAYPGGVTVTVTAVSDVNGFYRFGNLLLDEDYNGDGSGSEPTFTLTALPPGDEVSTQIDVNANGNDLEDSDDPLGVTAQPVQGGILVAQQAAPTSEPAYAGIDFGFHQPLRIGNRVWNDLDNDGVYEPGAGEPGLGSVVLSLLDDSGNPMVDVATGQPITTVTNVDGTFAFERVSSGEVVVQVDASNFDEWTDVLYGFYTSDFNVTPDPATDPDDGTDDDDNGRTEFNPATTGIAALPLTVRPGNAPTGESGEDVSFADDDSNLTVDFGFFELLTLGNRIWFDADDDGIIDAAEVGVDAGVILNLLDGSGAPVTDPGTGLPITTMTDAGGFYQFTNLLPGEYRVQIAAQNFRAGGLLEGFVSSGGAVDPDDNVDSDDNGVDVSDPAVSGISSLPITLAYDEEPPFDGTDGDSNDNTNLTVDFGVVDTPTAVSLLSFTASDLGGLQVRLRWETAAEIDNFGFRVYRSQSGDLSAAELVQFVPSTIPGGTGGGAVYSLLDTVTAPGAWTYWLVDVAMDGDTTVHDPVSVQVSPQFTLYLPVAVRP